MRRSSMAAMLLMALLAVGPQTSPVAAQGLPYTFFLTRYELGQSMNDMTKLERVRYHSDGQPFAKAPDGSTIAMSGQGAWEPTSRRATGGGQYTITDASGGLKAQGAWRVTGFASFQKLPGWWGVPGLKEEGWQGPPGSTSFSGFLTVSVNLDNQGDGVLEMWCLMPGVAKPGDHTGDGIALTGGNLNFPDYHDNEKGNQGIMFYSTDPADDGNVLTAEGTTTYRAGTPRALPAAGEYAGAPWAPIFATLGLGLVGAGLIIRRRPA